MGQRQELFPSLWVILTNSTERSTDWNHLAPPIFRKLSATDSAVSGKGLYLLFNALAILCMCPSAHWEIFILGMY